jgi:monovalent cation/hydrogen antiporter
MAFALGAVVSPTDAVATGAITQKLKIPARLTAILNGESLMNDATGLVAFKFALAAAIAGTFSLKAAAMEFGVLAAGGLILGFALAWLVGLFRDLLVKIQRSDPFIEVTISLLTPYAAYLAAEQLHLSSILAVVAAGLYSGWRDPLKMDVPTRQAAWSAWSVILFWLNGLAFILLGLQFPSLLASVRDHYSFGQLALFVTAVSGIAILARLLWMFPGAYLPFLISKRIRASEKRPPVRDVVVAGWAGMRGTITLAAALSIPQFTADGTPFPGRDIVIFLAFGVIAVTLLLQDTTLETLIRKLGVVADDTHLREEHLARLTAVEAGLKTLRTLEPYSLSPEEAAALGEVISEYEYRLAELNAEGETKTSARLRRRSTSNYRLLALHAERTAIDDLWRRDVITDEIHRPLQQLLDHEESKLKGHT